MAIAHQDYYAINIDFSDKINSFFKHLGVVPILNKIVVVHSDDYDSLIDTTSNVTIRSGKVERKERTVNKPFRDAEETPDYQNKVYVREKDNKVNLAQVMDAVLKTYLPTYTSSNVRARENFENAFKCYDKLSTEQSLRDFFILLCKNNDNLLRIAEIKVR